MRQLQGGFSFLELMTSVAVMGVLAYLSIPGFREFLARSYDARAVSDYANLKKIIAAGQSDPDDLSSFFIFNQVGPGNMPPPLQVSELSKGTRVDFALKFTFPGVLELTWLQVSHDKGQYYYRYVEVNDISTEQVIHK